MARQVLPLVGAVIGGIYGGPSGAQAGYAIGSLIGNEIDPVKNYGPRIGDASMQTSAEGVYRPIVMGTGAVKGNIIVRGNRIIKNKEEREGKGGPVTVTQRVYWTFAIRICEGPVGGILRIWQDEKLVYDIRPESPIPDETAQFGAKFRLYLGDEEQLPDPNLEAYMGVGNVPAYRGTCYAVFPNFDLTDQAERIPDFRFEVAGPDIEVTWSPKIISKEYFFNGTFDTLTVNPEDSFLQVNNRIYSLALSPDGTFAAIEKIHTTDQNPVAFRFNRDTNGFEVVSIPWPTDSCWGVAISPDGNYLGISGGSGKVYIFQVAEDPVTLVGSLDLGDIHGSLMWSPDSTTLAVVLATQRKVVRVAVSGGSVVEQARSIALSGVAGRTTPMAWRPGAYAGLIAISAGNIIHVLDTSLNVLLSANTGYTNVSGNGIFWSQVLDFFYCSNSNNSGEPVRIFRYLEDHLDQYPSPDVGPSGNFTASALSYDGRYFILVRGDGLTQEVITLRTNLMEIMEVTSSVTVNDPDELETIAINSGPSVAQASAAGVGLADIVTELHNRASREPVPFDVSALTDEVAGVVFSGAYTCAEAIATFMPIYTFDASEFDNGSGYRIHYIKRGAPIKAVLTIDDLIDIPDTTVRQDSLERPRVLHMQFQSPSVGYATAKATVRRNSPDVKVIGEKAIEVPMSFPDVNEAWRRADVLMKITWAEVGGEEEFTIPDSFSWLVPSDCIGISLREQTRRLRITSQSIEDGVIKVKAIPDRQSAVTSNITGVPLPVPTPPPPSIIGLTVELILDIPALVDTNDRLGYYVAVSGQTDAWHGAIVQRKGPADVDFTDIASFANSTPIGLLLEDIPSASEYPIDTTNVVKVRMYTDFEVQSLTDQQFLSEGGSFALEKDDGTWEILQYRDASDEGDRVFHLSHLARGRLNTGPSGHAAGARLVLLDFVRFVDAQSAWIGQTLTHRAISNGNSAEGSIQDTMTYVGRSQIEFPVAHILLTRDGNTIHARVVPRHRFGTEDNPIRSANWSGYRWTWTDGANSASVDSISDLLDIDVTGWSSPITVTVSQINRITGPGPSKSESVA